MIKPVGTVPNEGMAAAPIRFTAEATGRSRLPATVSLVQVNISDFMDVNNTNNVLFHIVITIVVIVVVIIFR